MVETVSFCLESLCSVSTLPLQEGALPALHVALVLGVTAVGAGLWIASLLARPWKGSHAGYPLTLCHLHDWLRLDGDGFVCLQCGYRAGSSLPSVRERLH
jgi:hypothetical protein